MKLTKYVKITLFLLAIVSLQSCQKNDEIEIDPNNLLIGNWVNPQYDGEKTTYQRANDLPAEAYGISFKQNGNFIERSSGFCGTPPLIFSDYEGLWQLEDALISITAQSFLGNYHWIVVSVTETELVLERKVTEQEIDYRNLMTLFDEIYALSTSVSCTDVTAWNYTAFGTRPCDAGARGYIAYSNEIDVANFLQKIAIYNEAEHQYNIKWDIPCTFEAVITPTNIECQNGFPVLIY